MPESLLTTKLFLPPTRSNLVYRERLIKCLNKGLLQKLILISAPAGFGKTTLLADWLGTIDSQIRVSWFSIDEGDNDLVRFFTYLVKAIGQVNGSDFDFGKEVLNILQTSNPDSIKRAITSLINEIVNLKEKIILVLDDYHLITNHEIHDAISFLIDFKPQQFHLIISTREDPMFSLVRYRARAQLTELRALDLRFSTQETEEFLNRVMGLDLSLKDIDALESRTEGWIAGLHLAAISMRGQSNISKLIESFSGSHRLILDYLVGEVLSQQSKGIQDFLVKTSILDRLNASICDQVTDKSNSQQILENLEQANLFIVPLDNYRNWYRYHRLFADLLQRRLKQLYPEEISKLHHRASRWCENNESIAESFDHALKAKDFNRAADLAEKAWREMNLGYLSVSWLDWVKKLPGELVQSRPMLSTGCAWTNIDCGDLEKADLRFKDAERWLESETGLKDLTNLHAVDEILVKSKKICSLVAWIANGRAYLSQAQGDYSSTLEFTKIALKCLPDDNFYERGLAEVLSGFAYWASGNLELACQSISDAVTNMKKLNNLTLVISFSSYLADIFILQGQLHVAEKVFLELLNSVTENGYQKQPATAVLYLGMSEIAYERGNLNGAKSYYLKSKELGETPNIPPWFRHWVLATIRIKIIEGDLPSAINILNNAERLYYRHPIPDVRSLKALTARVNLVAGKMKKALYWVTDENLSVDEELTFLKEFDHITFARFLIERSKLGKKDIYFHDAINLLERLLLAAEDGHRMRSMIEILILLAIAYSGLNNLPVALIALGRALRLAEPEGFVQVFITEGQAVETLLKQVTSEEYKIKAFILKLLSAFDHLPDEKDSIEQPMIDPLSDRELEILSLICQGLSNQEIGKELFLTINTVKVHTRNIYSKLGVNSRTKAGAKARDLGILSSS